MKNQYRVLKEKHQEEINNFPIGFAFDNKQFKESMEKLGLTEDDTDKVYSIGGGGFIRKTDSKDFSEMFARHDKAMKAAIDNDSTGENFIYDMFYYELANHEYSYTWELEPTLDALGLTMNEINANEKLAHGLKKARMAQSQ